MGRKWGCGDKGRIRAWRSVVLVLAWLMPGSLMAQASGRARDRKSDTIVSAAAQSGAESDPAAPDEPEEISLPRAVSVPVEYPNGATDDAVVVLQFVVTVDGLVKEVQVQNGDEPFASAAVSAATGWRFVPARRAGKAVPVRIQFEVRFEQETRPAETVDDIVPTDPLESAAQSSGSAEASIQTTFDIVVEGERRPASVTFSRAEARQIPGAFGDPFRAVEAMGGVSPVVSGLPVFYVRGAPPGNIGQYIDEVQIPLLYHAFLGPSVVHPLLIDSIHLYQGPYPANYGRHAGAVIAADLRRPSRELSYGFSVGIFDAGVYAETPFAGERGSAFVGGRYSYTGALVSALTPNQLQFWNYQVLADYDLTRSDVVGVFLLGGFDFFEGQEEEAGFFGREFHRADFRWDHSFSEDTSARVAVTLGADRTRWQDATLLNQSVAGRVRLRHRVSDALLLRLGLGGGTEHFELDLDSRSSDFEQLRALFSTHQDRAFGGFSELEWRPTSDITVTPGLRVDLFRSGSDSDVGVDPRLTARFRLSDSVSTVYGVGISHQAPNYIPEVPGARVAGLSGGLQRAVHTTAGAEMDLPLDFSGSVSLFNNAIFSVTDPFSATQDVKLRADVAKERPLAHSYGAELSLKRPLTRRLGAMLNYTLSRSTRSYRTYETLSGADRTHVLNLAGLYTLGANWRLGGRSVFYSGLPGRRRGELRLFDQSRAHPFFRLDLQLERRFRIGERSYWSVTAEVLNATRSTETLRRLCGADGECEDTEVGPVILPNIRVEGHF